MPKIETNKIYQGHVLEVLKNFPDESINCVITSPPYWGLRDYGLEPIIWDTDPNCEHEWGIIKERIDETGFARNRKGLNKAAEISDGNPRTATTDIPMIKKESQSCFKCSAWHGSLGLEPTPDLYIKHLLEIFDEVKRILKKDGTCWVNIGDSYGGNQGRGEGKGNEYNQKIKQSTGLAKSLVGIPEMFVLGMRDRGWIRRNTIVWYKRNCMPSSAKDRFTVDFEYVYFFTKTGKYWFEQQFEESIDPESYTGRRPRRRPKLANYDIEHCQFAGKIKPDGWLNDVGKMYPMRNKRCVWDIPTQPFSGAHFAVFPEALVEPMIKTGCPEFVCKKCGKAREKVYKEKVSFHSGSGKAGNIPKGKWEGKEQEISGDYDIRMGPKIERSEIGFTSCNCNANFESGIVLDPFCGSGTTLRVAEKFNRRWIGIDLSEKYIEMAKEKRLKEVQKILC